jgi:hypothetical protein
MWTYGTSLHRQVPATDDDEGGPKMTVNLLAANIDRCVRNAFSYQQKIFSMTSLEG